MRACQCRIVDKSAGRIVGAAAAAVGAVGVGRKAAHARGAAKVDGERQCIFLVGSALAVAAQGHGQLAAGEDHSAAAFGAQRQRALRVFGRHLARLALQAAAEHDAFITRGLRPLGRRRQRIRRPRHDAIVRAGENLRAGLRRFVLRILKRAANRVGQHEPIARNNRARVGER